MTLPDRFIDHDSPARQMIDAGLGATDIAAVALGLHLNQLKAANP
jgi:1-deoxy-D-xylulose-5-phosphate synthase